MEFTQDRCDILDCFDLNEMVEISFNLRGRIWINPQGIETFFNTIEAFRINKLEIQ